jgi:hypothetical protein
VEIRDREGLGDPGHPCGRQKLLVAGVEGAPRDVDDALDHLRVALLQLMVEALAI